METKESCAKKLLVGHVDLHSAPTHTARGETGEKQTLSATSTISVCKISCTEFFLYC